jgi:hypothetical protein
MTTPEFQVRQLLLDCLSRAVPEIDPARMKSLAPGDWRELLDLARSQRVLCLLWGRITDKGLANDAPSAIRDTMQAALRRNTMRNLRYYGELRRLCEALQAEGIPLILLKGIHLAAGVYGNMGLREMNDIDVLVRREHLTRTADILMDMGYAAQKTILPENTTQTAHHLPPLVKPGHACIEVHWNLTRPGKSYSMDPDKLWNRAVPVTVAGCEALALAPEDLLLHLCLHTSYQHQFAFGLRPSCDIAEIAHCFRETLDWTGLAERANQRGWRRGVYLAFVLANELAGAGVQDQVLEGLRPVDMTEQEVDMVRRQTFTDKHEVNAIPLHFAELLQSPTWAEKARIFWQRIFLPREFLAANYGVPTDSWKIYPCYPRRVFDLLRRHFGRFRRYQAGDEQFMGVVERRRNIAQLLEPK